MHPSTAPRPLFVERSVTATLEPPLRVGIQAQMIDGCRRQSAVPDVLLEQVFVALVFGCGPTLVTMGKIHVLTGHDSAKPHALDVKG
jgi:hypothetical protein